MYIILVLTSAALGVMCLAYLFGQANLASERKEQTLKEKYLKAIEEAKSMEILNTRLLVQAAIDNGNYAVTTTGMHLDRDSIRRMLDQHFPELQFNVTISQDCCSEIVNNIKIRITKPLVL